MEVITRILVLGIMFSGISLSPVIVCYPFWALYMLYKKREANKLHLMPKGNNNNPYIKRALKAAKKQ